MSKSLWWNPVVVIKLVLIKKILLILKVSTKEKNGIADTKINKSQEKKNSYSNTFIFKFIVIKQWFKINTYYSTYYKTYKKNTCIFARA